MFDVERWSLALVLIPSSKDLVAFSPPEAISHLWATLVSHHKALGALVQPSRAHQEQSMVKHLLVPPRGFVTSAVLRTASEFHVLQNSRKCSPPEDKAKVGQVHRAAPASPSLYPREDS